MGKAKESSKESKKQPTRTVKEKGPPSRPRSTRLTASRWFRRTTETPPSAAPVFINAGAGGLERRRETPVPA